MHNSLRILFVLGLSLGLIAADINLDDKYLKTSRALNETSVLAIREEGNSSSHDHASSTSKDDARRSTDDITSTLPSPLKPLISNPWEFVVDTIISTVRNNQQNMTQDSPSSSQNNDESKTLNSALPNSTLEPQTTTLKDISKSKFIVHESSSGLFLKDSNISLVTPVPADIITRLESSDKEIINSSSEMTTPLNKFQFSDNFREIKTDTTVKSFGSSEDDAYEMKELSMAVTTPSSQNEENLDLFFSKRQNKSASIDNQQPSANFIPSSVSTAPLSSSTSDTPTNITVSEFSDLPMNTLLNHDIYANISENSTANNPNFELEPEVATELTLTTLANHQILYKNSSKLADSDTILNENSTALLEEHDEYTVIVPKSCSNYSTISRLLHLLNTAPNNKITTKFECETLKNVKIVIKSKILMDQINELLKAETETDEMVSIKLQPNSTIAFDVFSQSPCDGGVLIPHFAIIIFGNVMLAVIIALVCWLCCKKKCRRHSTSLDLQHIPRLNLKADYSLTPIPRPSISFPDGHRDFLHAYIQDNRRRQDSNTLNQRPFSSNVVTTYEEVDNEMGSKQEMQTFTVSSGRKSEFKAPVNLDYASPHSSTWDRLHENNYPRKYGVDNPGYRKW